MSRITLKCVEKTFKEHKGALKKMFDLFPNATYQLRSTSFNGRNYEAFEVAVKPEQFAEIAQEYYIIEADLFEWGRPKIIESSFWTWKNDFIRITFSWSEEYDFYTVDYNKGYRHIKTSIHLQSREKSIGLKDWKKQYPAFLKLMDKNPNKELVEKFKAEVQEINAEVLKWESKLKELGGFKL